MKKILLLFTFLTLSISISAQPKQIIKGAVIDKYESPLPGAKVTTLNGAEVTTTNADGTFTLEVPVWTKCLIAQYEGMANKKINLNGEDVYFRMSPKIKSQWFILCNYTFLSTDVDNASLGGIMGGRMGKWGWYGNLGISLTDRNDVNGCFTVGVSKRIIDELHVYCGGGFVFTFDPCAEIGLIGKISNHLLLNAGYQVCPADASHYVKIGVGYAF